MCLAYLMQAMDKGTLALASIMGWQADVGARGQDYALTRWVSTSRSGKIIVVG